MQSERRPEEKPSAIDRLVMRIIERLESGDDILAQRIFGSLQIDGETHPTFDQVLEFVVKERQARQDARGKRGSR